MEQQRHLEVCFISVTMHQARIYNRDMLYILITVDTKVRKINKTFNYKLLLFRILRLSSSTIIKFLNVISRHRLHRHRLLLLLRLHPSGPPPGSRLL